MADDDLLGHFEAAARPPRGHAECSCCKGRGEHGDGSECTSCQGLGHRPKTDKSHCEGQPAPRRRHWRQGSVDTSGDNGSMDDPDLVGHFEQRLAAMPKSAMAWENRGGKDDTKYTPISVRHAGFAGLVGDSEYDRELREELGEPHAEDGDWDEDLYDEVSPEPTKEEHAHYAEHEEWPDSFYERHDQAYQNAVDERKRRAEEEDTPDHEDPGLMHFVRNLGSATDLWKQHGHFGPVSLKQPIYATQSHVAREHIERYQGDREGPSHHRMQYGAPMSGHEYLGDSHPLFVTHEGRTHAIEGHHRVATDMAMGRHETLGWHFDLDKHPRLADTEADDPEEWEDKVQAEHHDHLQVQGSAEDLPELHRGIAVAVPPEVHHVVSDESRPMHERAQHLLDHVTREGLEPLGQHWTTNEDDARFFTHYNSPGAGGKGWQKYQVVFHAAHPGHDAIIHDPDWREEHEVNDLESEQPVEHGTDMDVRGITWRHKSGYSGGTAPRHAVEWNTHRFGEPKQEHTASASDDDAWQQAYNNAAERLFGKTEGDEMTDEEDQAAIEAANREHHGHTAAIGAEADLKPQAGGLENPYTHGSVWYHGTQGHREDFEHGFQDPAGIASGAYQIPESESDDTGHWNRLLGTHLTADHAIAAEFAKGEHSGFSNDGYGDEDEREEHKSVIHAQVHLKNPKFYDSEHDMDREAYEHEHGAGNHIMNHLRDYDDDPEYGHEMRNENWPGAMKIHWTYGDKRIPDSDYGHYNGGGLGIPGHPMHTAWLNYHPDKFEIAKRFKQRLMDAGHDGIVYRNEYETGNRGRAANTSVVAFHPDQVHITQHHHVDEPHDPDPAPGHMASLAALETAATVDPKQRKKDYRRGWDASVRAADSTSYGPSALERADDRGEVKAWYEGYLDHATDRPKHHALECDAPTHDEGSCTLAKQAAIPPRALPAPDGPTHRATEPVIEALAQASAWSPDSGHDIVATVDGLPAIYKAAGRALGVITDRLEEAADPEHMPPAALECLGAMSRDFTAQASQAEETGKILRDAHAKEIARLTDPRPAEEVWDAKQLSGAAPKA